MNPSSDDGLVHLSCPKVLIWESADFKVWLSFNSPEYLQRRHKFPSDLLPNIAGMAALLQTVVAS